VKTRHFTFLLLLSYALAATAAPAAEKALNVVASFYPMYVAALNVTADVPGVKVTCLTEPFVGCLHDYQLKPADLKTLSKADVFVANGAGMESFLDKVLAQLPQVKIINASEGARLVDGNAHLWVSLSGAMEQVERIAKALGKADPVNADQYKKNARAYNDQLETLQDEMRAALKRARNRDIITFHEAFPYFAAEFKLNVVGVVEREPGTQPNARELADTIKLIRSKKASALFAELQYSSKSADVIARETGIKVSYLDPVATGPVAPEKARGYYLETMRKNLAALKEALPQD
jgi:zinc transport system substrate-binding protein